MEYLYDYLSFFARAITIVVAVLIIVSSLAAAGMRRQHGERGHLKVKRVNDELQSLQRSIQEALQSPGDMKKLYKKDQKSEKKRVTSETPKLYILGFKGDIQASGVNKFRKEITAVLSVVSMEDEVLVKIESPGGMVHSYGLAASQLHRLKGQSKKLVVAVDKVAASGGYMMAVVADKILAAPFAVIGSIGVVAQIPNVHKLLKKHDVDFDVLTAGEYKRTLTVFGENTAEGREKFISELDDTHALFKSFVSDNRPDLNIDKVATGETWYGQRALAQGLVDEIITSDEYTISACEDKEVLAVEWVEHKSPVERILGHATVAFDHLWSRITGGVGR